MSDDPKYSLEDHEEIIDEQEEQYEDYETDKNNLISFLQHPKNKRRFAQFVEETYKGLESEHVERLINRIIHQHRNELQGSTPYYKPGHIGPLMYQYLNMLGVENAFVSALQHTKSSMTKSVQQRVDEVNTLLRGVGGFNRQIKSSFSRNAVIYLEQEDPKNKHRERVIFTVNLGDFELKKSLDESTADIQIQDGRTLRRQVWDEAVNTLAEIISNTGMKPKYVKNDKNSCHFTMKQYLLPESTKTPDEFFTFDLKYMNEEEREKLTNKYIKKLNEYTSRINFLKQSITSKKLNRKKRRAFESELDMVKDERDFFVGTTPDPREMDPGLIFSIYANTSKDYTITKDKMQVIMTKYILTLSSIAADKTMDEQVNTIYQTNKKKPQRFQEMEKGETSIKKKDVVIRKEDLIKKKVSGGDWE